MYPVGHAQKYFGLGKMRTSASPSMEHHLWNNSVGLKPGKTVHHTAGLHYVCGPSPPLPLLLWFKSIRKLSFFCYWSPLYFHSNLCLWVSILFYQRHGAGAIFWGTWVFLWCSSNERQSSGEDANCLSQSQRLVFHVLQFIVTTPCQERGVHF